MKWEYRVVTSQSNTLEQELNRLGAEEWEVIGASFDRAEVRPSMGVQYVQTVQVTVVLKRLVR